MSRCFSNRLQGRKAVSAYRQRMRLLDPVLGEHRLEPANDGPFQSQCRVSPVLGVFAVAEPLVGDAMTEGVSDAPIDDEHLAMRAAVEPTDVPPSWRAVLRHLYTALAQRASSLLAS